MTIEALDLSVSARELACSSCFGATTSVRLVPPFSDLEEFLIHEFLN